MEEKDQTLSTHEIITKYQDEISEINTNQEWWVFGEVSKHLNYEIFMAEADEIGYKRTKRGDQKQPNELFQENECGNIIIDIENPKAILDFLKPGVRWD